LCPSVPEVAHPRHPGLKRPVGRQFVAYRRLYRLVLRAAMAATRWKGRGRKARMDRSSSCAATESHSHVRGGTRASFLRAAEMFPMLHRRRSTSAISTATARSPRARGR
jgi:hypothetical protein